MKKTQITEKIINTPEQLRDQIQNENSLENCVIKNLDLRKDEIKLTSVKISNTSFLGCSLTNTDCSYLIKKGATVFTEGGNFLPYKPFRDELYTWQELMEGYSPDEDNSIDWKIYNHFLESKFNPPINKALYQRIHDHSIDMALKDLLVFDDEGMPAKNCVGIMGGHSLSREDDFFLKTALTAKLLTERGFLIVSGGGPGIMEAANLGAYFADRTIDELNGAIEILKSAPTFKDRNFVECAKSVLEKYPDGKESIAIPTWFYGHEPSNLFASKIAKYFSNSIREDTLLAISIHGVIYAPGSAGTTQEIFMDATQNHYGTFNYYSPMVFLGKERYEIKTMIFPLLKQLSWGQPYHNFLFISDHPKEIADFLEKNKPLKKI
jgi:predicted Rossmann-fold nucleotide-binding protein